MNTKLLLVLITALSLSLNACSFNTNDRYSKSTTEKLKGAQIISSLKSLNKGSNQIYNKDLNKEVGQFLQGYNHIKTGKIIKAEDIFQDLLKGQNEAQEYGLYGLLLISVETENMSKMIDILKRIEGAENKSDWLEKELAIYKIYYNYNLAEFDKAKSGLNAIDIEIVKNRPLLSSIKTILFIRENKLKQATQTLEELKQESFDSIATRAFLMSITEGHPAVVNYLDAEVDKYPNNEYLNALRNIYLVSINENEAFDNAYKLSLNSNNTYNIVLSIETLLVDVRNAKQDRIERINTLFNKKLKQLDGSDQYIDYYLANLMIPSSHSKTLQDINLAEKFNPSNFKLLWHKYYAAEFNNKLDILQKIENIDPYDNSILLELAKFYKYKGMSKELSDIKQRFRDSKRIKTEDEIEFINSL